MANLGGIHVRHDGNSYDFSYAELDVGDLSSDNEIKTSVANTLNISLNVLSGYDMDRNQVTGDITLRPRASFG